MTVRITFFRFINHRPCRPGPSGFTQLEMSRLPSRGDRKPSSTGLAGLAGRHSPAASTTGGSRQGSRASQPPRGYWSHQRPRLAGHGLPA
ncbi:hypothetical protein B1T49_11970 [Mycobacterium persicum]|nr:hypothetical protein B1T49_11970 [Mycobacterium persicum]